MKHKKEWQLQEAKNKFSEVFNASLKNGAQTITRNGKDRVLLIALKDYQKLLNQHKGTLAQFLQKAPFKVDEFSLERDKSYPRAVDL